MHERVWLLAAQKPISGPGWWKGKICFISDAGNYRAGGRHLSKGQPPDRQRVRAFRDKVAVGRRRRVIPRSSAVTSDNHLH